MVNTITTVNGTPVLVCSPDGKKLKSEEDALELIGEALGTEAELILVPVERFEAEEFFQLKTGLLGHFIQKFVNYRRKLVIIGDISQHLSQSRALRDFVYEANRGEQLWFVTELAELQKRLVRPH